MKELIKLAEEKGFNYIDWINELICVEDLSHQFWLFQLQKWLRESHNIYAWVFPKFTER